MSNGDERKKALFLFLSGRTTSGTGVAGNNHVGKSVDEMRKENIQLFMKCEEYRMKENEMEQTVKDLEKEVEEAKSKCAQLALLMEAKRKEILQI